ncbi:MAG: methyltransferase domain-containing protein [Flavobacteriales bacterium]|nr:methyltransferase domain-containing protein [Flavobacteriales bacterium]MCB9447558.1 methyltransferase domain-containing protein [Flavobacteriales bacterium]
MRDLKDYQEKYASLAFEDYQVHYRKKCMKACFDQYKPRVVLEIGCGLEPIYDVLTSFDKLVIVEPAQMFVDHALADIRKKGLEDRVDVFPLLMEDAKTKIAGYNFDMVLMSGLLNEVPDPKGMLEVVRDVVGKDTIVHVNVANANSFHRLLALEMGLINSTFEKSQQQLLLQGNTVYDKHTLAKLVTDAGFDIVEAGSYFVKPFTHKQMKQLMDTGIADERMLDGLYAMTKYMPDMGSEIFVNLKRNNR